MLHLIDHRIVEVCQALVLKGHQDESHLELLPLLLSPLQPQRQVLLHKLIFVKGISDVLVLSFGLVELGRDRCEVLLKFVNDDILLLDEILEGLQLDVEVRGLVVSDLDLLLKVGNQLFVILDLFLVGQLLLLELIFLLILHVIFEFIEVEG